jgi:hypothetical protein
MYEYNRFYLDIGVSGYWEEYFPLSLFATYATSSRGERYYDLDFIQYNLGYPTTYSTVETSASGSWTYEELRQEYLLPVERPYDQLDNEFLTGYANYNDLKNKVIKTIEYDFSESSVRSFITFQKVSDGANRPINDFEYDQSLPSTNILDIPEYSNQFNTKFEIKDRSIVYPPKSIGIENTAVVLHLDVNVRGIITNPLNLRRLALSSKALSETSFNEIGTRFGTPVYPYSKVGFYFDTKSKNPYAIYKDSNPYLYLTKYSGIESMGNRSFDVERGLSMPVNIQQTPDFKVTAMQIWIKYSEDIFPQTGSPLFSLDTSGLTINFNVVTDQSAERGRIYATNASTREVYEDLIFYQNGIEVINPYITKEQWVVIGVAFNTPVEVSNYLGSLNMFQGAVFNDMSFYRATSLQEVQSITYRPWIRVKTDPEIDPVDDLEWNYWLNNVPSWDSVLKISELRIYGVSPETLFKAYTGTNREIVDDSQGLLVLDDGLTILTDAEWVDYFRKPV